LIGLKKAFKVGLLNKKVASLIYQEMQQKSNYSYAYSFLAPIKRVLQVSKK